MAEPGEEPGAVPRREGGRRARARPVNLDKLLEGLQPETPVAAKALENSIGMAFVLVPAGSFQMGSGETETGHRLNESPVHEVVIGNPFYLSIHLVTQAAYVAIMGHNPSRFTVGNGGRDDQPVEMVSWEEATAFCRRLTDRTEERMAGRRYRLPTEAEWEYACRSGTSTPFGHGPALAHGQGNFDAAYPYGDGATAGSAVAKTTPVSRYPAGAWGLHDMHGNVWEWCADWYAEGYYRTSPLRDPPGPASGKFKVLRGGSWRNQASACRAAYRNALAPHQKDSATGFRVVMMG